MGTIRHPEGYCVETCSEDQRKEMAKEWVGRHTTAILTPRASDPLTGLSLEDYSGEAMQITEDETSYHWHPSRDYFPMLLTHTEILLFTTCPTWTLM